MYMRKFWLEIEFSTRAKKKINLKAQISNTFVELVRVTFNAHLNSRAGTVSLQFTLP